MRVMGVDFGARRIGVAVSDPGGRIASPLCVLEATGDYDEDARRVAELAREHGAELIVVGLPRTLRGTDESAARAAGQFADCLQHGAGMRVVLWDERLTSVQAERAMAEAGLSARQRREQMDKVAAALILQSYLDARHAKKNSRKGPGRASS
ncbi:MAG: Holliday junction resolvase RuvX [Armatimonadetes bacterium]|nr:Holliday junction resolvase RuvX [Armatimonadota bacterium]